MSRETIDSILQDVYASAAAHVRNGTTPSPNEIQDFRRRIGLSLSAQGEAVAWQYLGTSSLAGPFPHPEWWICEDHEAARKAGFEVRPLYTHPAPVRVTEWTDDQCIAFACVAFRHAPKNLPKGVELNDIRMGAIAAVRSALEADHG